MSWLKNLWGSGTCEQPMEQHGQTPYTHQQYGVGFSVTTDTAADILMAQQTASGYGNGGGGGYISSASNPFRFPGTPLRAVVTADLNTPAFQSKLEDLANAWILKFGEDWVDRDEILNSDDPEFFSLAAQRLMKAGRLEEHTLGDSFKTVYKVVEK